MPTRVKICGITRRDDAELAVELGASALGFNFFPPSPRYIAPAAAREIIRRLPPFVMAVGVFADEADAAHIMAVAHEAGVSVVQLHGPRFPQFDGAPGQFSVIRAMAVKADFVPEELAKLQAAAFLLDSFDPALRGGTGKVFDWSIAREAKRYGTIILAGGLTPENVGEAIKQVRPYAVDVATGVECTPGIKDPARLRAFFAEVAKADREL
ncbi:MAG: phosphoribosylanthranilate isomerase [Acidobacteriia bacterium]|nr:phosphoribosylanthranilate isomerase [Terriglobia bacterium]